VQATEALKLLVGTGETLAGRLLVYDAAGLSMDSVPIRSDPDCPVCGADPSIASVAEASYEQRCSLPE
jgi:adenylyltransferase/sulfurtransferase